MARALVKEIKDTRKNYFINSDMQTAQRGTSFSAIANGAYSLDRYQYEKSGAMVHTVTQDTDVPTVAQASYTFQNSMRLNLTTPDTSIAAGEYTFFGQKIEGYNFVSFAQKVFIVSFWVKATLAGTYCVAARNGAQNLSYIAEYTINAANTWERKTVTIAASPAAGTWNYTTGTGIHITWALAVGTTFQTTAGTWQSGNFLGTSNQVNGVNTGATDFRVTGVQVNEGSASAPYSLFGEDVEGEVMACQRYYEKSYDLTVNPATNTIVGSHWWSSHATDGGGDNIFTSIPYKTSKRVAGHTVFLYDIVGNINRFSVTNGGGARTDNQSNIAGANPGVRSTEIQVVMAVNNFSAGFHYTADSEL